MMTYEVMFQNLREVMFPDLKQNPALNKIYPNGTSNEEAAKFLYEKLVNPRGKSGPLAHFAPSASNFALQEVCDRYRDFALCMAEIEYMICVHQCDLSDLRAIFPAAFPVTSDVRPSERRLPITRKVQGILDGLKRTSSS